MEEAYTAGKMALESAVAGNTDKMVAFKRAEGVEYRCETTLIDLIEVANMEKKIPRNWINEAGNGLRQEFIDYALPLIQGDINVPKQDGLPRFAKLKRIMTREI